jgi:methylated-DNA-[protein]-cysteine S-methyltransferase
MALARLRHCVLVEKVMSLAQARVDTPLGAVRQAATDEGLTGLWFRGQQHESPSLVASVDAASHPVLAAEAC